MSADEYNFHYPPGEKPHEEVLAGYAAMEIYGKVIYNNYNIIVLIDVPYCTVCVCMYTNANVLMSLCANVMHVYNRRERRTGQ